MEAWNRKKSRNDGKMELCLLLEKVDFEKHYKNISSLTGLILSCNYFSTNIMSHSDGTKNKIINRVFSIPLKIHEGGSVLLNKLCKIQTIQIYVTEC